MWNTTPFEDEILFWDCDRKTLSTDNHEEFIIGRILEFGDIREIKWLFQNIGKEKILKFISDETQRRLSAKTVCFWRLILS